MRDRVLDFLSERGTLADEQAVEYLLTQADPLGAADRVLRAFPDPPFVLTLKDITGHSTCEGTLADFGRYFRHRFVTISRLLRSRPELSGAMEMSRAKKLTRDTAIIGMVTEARTTKNGHRILEIEDETDSVSVLLPADSSMASD